MKFDMIVELCTVSALGSVAVYGVNICQEERFHGDDRALVMLMYR